MAKQLLFEDHARARMLAGIDKLANAVAVTMGPIAIIAAVGSTLVITVSVISYFVHGERLTRRQMAAIGVVVCAIVVVRVSEGFTQWIGL